MQETPNDGLTFLDMQLKHAANDGPPAQGTDYAPMWLRDHDENMLPAMQADHEQARRDGSKG